MRPVNGQKSHEAAAKAASVYVTPLARSALLRLACWVGEGKKSNSSTTLQPYTRIKSIGCACGMLTVAVA